MEFIDKRKTAEEHADEYLMMLHGRPREELLVNIIKAAMLQAYKEGLDDAAAVCIDQHNAGAYQSAKAIRRFKEKFHEPDGSETTN